MISLHSLLALLTTLTISLVTSITPSVSVPVNSTHSLVGKVEIWSSGSIAKKDVFINTIPNCKVGSKSNYTFEYGSKETLIQFGLLANEKCDMTLFYRSTTGSSVPEELMSINLSDSKSIALWGFDQAIIKEFGVTFSITKQALTDQPNIPGPLRLIAEQQNIIYDIRSNKQSSAKKNHYWKLSPRLDETAATLNAYVGVERIFHIDENSTESGDLSKLSVWFKTNGHMSSTSFKNFISTIEPKWSGKKYTPKINGALMTGGYQFSLESAVNEVVSEYDGVTQEA